MKTNAASRDVVLRMLALILALSGYAAGVPEAPVVARANEPPGVGERAPDFTLEDQHGEKVTLSKIRGEKVVLVFYRGYW